MDAAHNRIIGSSPPTEVSDDELVQIIADFLSLGHVENIVAMFRQEPQYYQWTGLLLNDSRFALDHFITKLFKLCEGFKTATGRRLAAERHARLQRFYDDLLEEI